MKNYIYKLLSIISLVILSLSILISSQPKLNIFLKNQDIIILDNDSKELLPNRFRYIPSLNISGSAQFTQSQISNIKNTINKPNICIVDLRQESHGLLNDIAICYHNFYKLLNNGFNSIESIEKENSELSRIKIDTNVSIFRDTGRLYNCINSNYVSNEEDAITTENLQYKRFSVRDGGVPTPEIVDDFINFINANPTNLHLHFHCQAGEGRTTLFMSLYQIMKNDNNLTLDQILTYQYNIGGILLTNDGYRLSFLNEFYNYVKENKSNSYSISYSDWIKNESTCKQ